MEVKFNRSSYLHVTVKAPGVQLFIQPSTESPVYSISRIITILSPARTFPSEIMANVFQVRLMQKQSTTMLIVPAPTLTLHSKLFKIQHWLSTVMLLVWLHMYVSLYVFFCPLQLLLVLPLCGSEEILQEVLQVVKRGSVLWSLRPTLLHDVIKLIRAVFWRRHPVSPLQVLDHFWVGHTWTGNKIMIRWNNNKKRIVICWYPPDDMYTKFVLCSAHFPLQYYIPFS